MGDSSEGVSSVHATHFQKCDSFKYIDDGDSVGDDAHCDDNTISKSAVILPLNNVLSNGDQSISSDSLSKPVPPKREGDTYFEVTNGHDDFAEKEPIITKSMILGKEANGFDEAVQVGGSDEDVSTPIDSDNSGSWIEQDVSDESSETDLQKNDMRRQTFNDIITSNSFCELSSRRSHGDFEDLKTGRPLNGQSSNLHKELYSPKARQDYVGYGEKVATYNYPSGYSAGNSVRTSDTCNSLGTTFSGMYTRVTGCGLAATPSLCVTSTTPRPSVSSPVVSGGCNSRQHLPYEVGSQPPYGKVLDEPRLRQSALRLLPSHDRIVSPRGMPKAEPIILNKFESTGAATSINDAETNKKKKKKKKRNNGAMKGDSDAADAKFLSSPLRDDTNIVAPTTYPHSMDTGSPVMDHDQRNKLSRGKGGKKKKKAETVIKAREIAGNRGGDDVDILVGYVEGGRKKAAGGSATQDRKTRRQRPVGRMNEDKVGDSEKEKEQELKEETVITETEKKDETVRVKEELDLEFTNFEGLVDLEEELPFEKYMGRRKKVRGTGSVKLVSQSTPTPSLPPPSARGGTTMRWGMRGVIKPFVRPPPPTHRPPPAKEEFPPLSATTSTLTKISWNFQQVQHFLETLYPGEKEKCSFYSDAGRRAHHLPPSTPSS